MRAVASFALGLWLLAGCGDQLERSNREPQLDLEVTVRPEGPDRPARRRSIECGVVRERAPDPTCRRLGRLRHRALAPVPARTACVEVFGGPATARVSGTLRGRRVAAAFNLSDGCEIARWRRNAALLGPPPSELPPPADG